ncbi:uncharacterized protein LOC143025612 [Oratosquilla oratoria]|uniref:uncharacterized protein LOC143025612 n=1 Tax=Oratosquilla oratoria TaxID=337810 RepID=UPI003F7675D2
MAGKMYVFCFILAMAFLATPAAGQFDPRPLNRPPEVKIGENCALPRIHLVVCGSDGYEYVNEAELRCARRSDPGLSVAREGRCVDGLLESKLKAASVINRFNRRIDQEDEVNKPMAARQ